MPAKQQTIEAVLFDLDGTLVDTAGDFIPVVNAMRHERGLGPLADDEIRKHVSNGARALTRECVMIDEAASDFEQKTQELKDRYGDSGYPLSTLYAGFDELLDYFALQQIRWGIVTNKPSIYAEPLMASLQLANPAGCIVCPNHVSQSKPHPEPMLLACKQIGVEAQNCIYVGDHKRDIDAGKAANMQSIAVRWGYIEDNDAPEKWQADAIIDHPLDIKHFL